MKLVRLVSGETIQELLENHGELSVFTLFGSKIIDEKDLQGVYVVRREF